MTQGQNKWGRQREAVTKGGGEDERETEAYVHTSHPQKAHCLFSYRKSPDPLIQAAESHLKGTSVILAGFYHSLQGRTRSSDFCVPKLGQERGWEEEAWGGGVEKGEKVLMLE